MITTKTCSTCEHFPNDHHCVGCAWDEAKRENTKWELKKNPIVIERSVLDKIRAEIEGYKSTIDNAISEDELKIEGMKEAYVDCLKIIDKYKASPTGAERSDKE